MRQVWEPAYLALHRSGDLARRASDAYEHLADCDLCGRYCHVNRRISMEGVACRTGVKAVVHSYGPHHGEEDPIRGWAGSGTIFFSWCNMRCVFCQNWEISQKGSGREVTATELAEIMLRLQAQGCHNINLVSPSHIVAQILAALNLAVDEGLCLPLVYNTGGFDSLEALTLLRGVIDIYMPDVKYADSKLARSYSRIRDYAEINRRAIKEMHDQVGDLELDDRGIARRGLLIRHLVLPGQQANTEDVLAFIADEVSNRTYINIMDQYRPCYRAEEVPELNRPLGASEYHAAREHGLVRLDKRRLV